MAEFVHFSDAANLAFHCMAHLGAHPGEYISTHNIAETYSASAHHLAKVVQRLHKAGLVNSLRGPHGGITLAQPPIEVNLLQIYEAIEGPVKISTCLFTQPVCSRRQCIFAGVLAEANTLIYNYLAQTTLHDLIAP